MKKHKILGYQVDFDSVEFVNITWISCTECDKIFTEKHTLNVHIMAKLTNERPFKCDLCGKSFIMEHKMVHDSIYICNYFR